MAPATVKEKDAPLLEKTKLDAAETPIQARVAVSNGNDVASYERKAFDFLFHRTTYYSIALIAQFCHITLCFIGFGVGVAHKDANAGGYHNGDIFLLSAIYSIFSYLVMLSLLVHQHKKNCDVGPKPFLAGKHYACARFSGMMNLINLVYILVPVLNSEGTLDFVDDIRPVVIPLMIGFLFVAMTSSAKAAYITRFSAKSARGSELVVDPNNLVPAWTLATTEESQIYSRSNGALQLGP